MGCPSLRSWRAWLARALCLLALAGAMRAPAAITFVEIPTGFSNVAPGTVAWGDYDNDGDLDVLLTGLGVAAVWRNDGSNVFTLAGQMAPGFDIPFQYEGSLAWVDWD